jgi:hypothetical protein
MNVIMETHQRNIFMKKLNPITLIGLCHKVPKLSPAKIAFGEHPEIQVHIGMLDPKDCKPRNFSLSSLPFDADLNKAFAGNCHARIWASDNGNIFSDYGPDIHWGDLREYEYALKAVKRIAKNWEAIKAVRAYSRNEAESMGRWLECCGVFRVFLRPEGEEREWMSEGAWHDLSIGDFISRCDRALYVKTEPAAEPVAA